MIGMFIIIKYIVDKLGFCGYCYYYSRDVLVLTTRILRRRKKKVQVNSWYHYPMTRLCRNCIVADAVVFVGITVTVWRYVQDAIFCSHCTPDWLTQQTWLIWLGVKSKFIAHGNVQKTMRVCEYGDCKETKRKLQKWAYLNTYELTNIIIVSLYLALCVRAALVNRLK